MHWEYEKYADYGLFLVVLIEQTNFGFESTKIRVETAEIFWFDSSPVSIETFPANGWVAGSNGSKTNWASIEVEIELRLSLAKSFQAEHFRLKVCSALECADQMFDFSQVFMNCITSSPQCCMLKFHTQPCMLKYFREYWIVGPVTDLALQRL